MPQVYEKPPEEIKKIVLVNYVLDRNSVLFAQPKEKLIYLLMEPFEVDSSYYDLFSKVYSWDDARVNGINHFKINYPYLMPMSTDLPAFENRKLCTMIATTITKERFRVLEFFENKPNGDLDFFGRNGINSKCYRGPISGKHSGDEKLATLTKYRFCFCFENHVTLKGYITEKIFNCFATGCIPIYWGAPNIQNYIPNNCFIDYRDFNSDEDLYKYLKAMTHEEYEAFLVRIRQYLQSDQAQLFSPAAHEKIFREALIQDTPLSSIPNISAHIRPEETPTLKYLKTIDVANGKSGIDLIDCVYVINLDARPEKWERTNALLNDRGIHANRVSAVNGWQLTDAIKKELSGPYIVRLQGGPIGCLLSHFSVYKDAFDRGFDTIWVLEDDIEILGDVNQIPELLKKLGEIDPDWDIFYTDRDCRHDNGGYFDFVQECGRPDQHLFPSEFYCFRKDVGNGMMQIRGRYGTTSMIISRKGLEKIINYLSHVYLWTAIDCDIHFVPGINEYCSLKEIVTNLRDSVHSDTGPCSTLNVR
ncbi:MAG: glycosyltransferase family 10 [Parachlamydiaceae bacterium]